MDLIDAPRKGRELQEFPVELLKKIAVFCSGKSRLALSETCRLLHSVCNDIMVIRESVENQFAATVLDGGKAATTSPLDTLKLRAGCDVGVWHRYSVAADELASLPDLVDKLGKNNVSLSIAKIKRVNRVMAFMPEMLALGCVEPQRHTATLMTACLVTPRATVQTVSLLDKPTLLKLAFCFAAENVCFSTLPTPGGPLHNALSRLHIAHDSFPRLAASMFDDLAKSRQFLSDDPRVKYLFIGLLSRALKEKQTGAKTPIVDEIPMLSALDNAQHLPLPFDLPSYCSSSKGPAGAAASSQDPAGATAAVVGSSGWEKWLRRTECELWTRKYLSTGEWRGWRSSDPRMKNLVGPIDMGQFMVTQPPNAGYLEFRCHGRQANDLACVFEGRINPANGWFEILQNFPGFHVSRWQGFLTPFGMVGFWQSSHVSYQPVGVFWMWKRSPAV